MAELSGIEMLGFMRRKKRSRGGSASLPEFATIPLGIAGVDDGSSFVLTPSTGDFGAVFTRQGSDALFVRWDAVGTGAFAASTLLSSLRGTASRATYEYDFRLSFDGRVIPNVGTVGDADPIPHMQLLAGQAGMFDADGGTASTRTVWPAGVLNALGDAECMQLVVTATTQIHYFGYIFDYGSLPSGDYTIVVNARQTSGTSSIKIGSTSDVTGTVSTVTPGATTSQYEVDAPGWSGASSYSLAIRPGAGAGTPVPYTLVFERIAVYPKDTVIPSLTDWRANRNAGHALASFGASGALNTTAAGIFEPDAKAAVMTVDMPGVAITSVCFSWYANLADQVFPVNETSALGFPREENPGTDNATYGKGAYDTSGAGEYAGRAIARIGGENISLTQAPDTILIGAGWHRMDLQVGGDGSEAAQLANQAVAGDRRLQVYVDGMQQCDLPIAAFPSTFKPKTFQIGGLRSAVTDISPTLSTGAFLGEIMSPRIRINQGLRTATEIANEMEADLASGRGQLATPVVHIITENDSTGKFAGSPVHLMARTLKGSGRIFSNIAQGGSFFDESVTVSTTTDNVFNKDTRIALRQELLRVSTEVRQFPLTIYGYHGGENNATHLDEGGTGVAAYNKIKAMWMAEVSAYQNASFPICPVIYSVRPSGDGGVGGATNAAKVIFNTYLRSIFTVATSVSYLWKSPNPATTGFEYMIDLDAWRPKSDANLLTYLDWYDYLANYDGAGLNNDVLDGGGQHWKATTGGKWADIEVYSPSMQAIALDYGITL